MSRTCVVKTMETTLSNFPDNITISEYTRDTKGETETRGETLVQGLLYILMALVGGLGNTLVLIVVSLSRNLQNVTSVFVVMLTASDLLVCVIILPISTSTLFNGRTWPMAAALCDISGIAYVVFRWTSIWAIMLVSIDRCVAIRIPLRYTKLVTIKRASVAVCLAVLLVLFLSLLPIAGVGRYKYSAGKALCAPDYEENPGYSIALLVGASCLPIFVTLGMYICVTTVALKTARKGTIVCDENNCTYVPSKKAEFKAVKTFCILTGAFMFCWLPYIGANLWLLRRDHHLGHVPEALTECLALLSSVINPWMYSLLNKSFKLAIKKLKHKVKVKIEGGETTGETGQSARTSHAGTSKDSRRGEGRGGEVAQGSPELPLNVVQETSALKANTERVEQTVLTLTESATTENM